MSWRLDYSPAAKKQLEKLDRFDRDNIARWMHNRINGCDDPRVHGRALVHNLSGLWRYRVGKYRVICELHDDELVVLAVEVGHRGKVYK